MYAICNHQTKIINLHKLQDMLLSGEIRLDAEYQREVVWPTAKMTFLIDSIIKKFYVPPLLFAVKTDEEGKTVSVCIDGKQRLTSILRFTQNQIPYLDDTSGFVQEVYFEQVGHDMLQLHQKSYLSFRYFTEQEKGDFYDNEITVVEFHNLHEDEELEIFSRIQMGVAMTAAEKLTATSSEISKLCHMYISTHLHLNATLVALKTPSFRSIAQILYCIYEQNNSFVATYPRLHKFMRNRGNVLTATYKRTSQRTIRLLDQICQDKNGREAMHNLYMGGLKISEPLKNIELIVFGVFISKTTTDVTVTELIDDLIDMRVFFRHQNLRTLKIGNPCWLIGMTWARQRLASKTSPSSSSSSTCSDSSDLRDDITGSEEPRTPSPSRIRPMARRGGKRQSSPRSTFIH